VVLAALSSARQKGIDAKNVSQASSMRAQAQLWTPSGTAVAAAPTAIAVSALAAAGTAINLFDDTVASNSLYSLFSGISPTTTQVFYGSEATTPSSGGKWFFVVATSTGSFCVDYTGSTKTSTVAVPASATVANWQAMSGYSNLTSTLYSCN
jgi:hypothetical protein